MHPSNPIEIQQSGISAAAGRPVQSDIQIKYRKNSELSFTVLAGWLTFSASVPSGQAVVHHTEFTGLITTAPDTFQSVS